MGLLIWKLRREIDRIGQQLQGIPEFFLEPKQRRKHDASRATVLKTQSGEIAERKKIALLLVYQPTGISDSTRWTCEHLVNRGYAPLIVSNAPLSSKDRLLLAPWTWRMTERPNFGYDFGGYRDGIWLLQQWDIDPEVLIILNDSIWFPLSDEEILIKQMEAVPADVVGALQLDPLRQTDGIPEKKRPFFGSFFLMIKRAAWKHTAFKHFWETYRITSNKYKTIRRGERGFSHAMIDAGLTCQAIYTRSALDEHIQALPNESLLKFLCDLVSIDDTITVGIKEAAESFSDTPVWRSKAMGLAMAATEKQNILATAPITSLTTFKVPYLKKARDKNNLAALRTIRQRMAQHALPAAHPTILDEIDKVLGQQERAFS